MARSDRRREPVFDNDDARGDLRADPHERPPAQGKQKSRAAAAREDEKKDAQPKSRAKARSGLGVGRLVYWSLVLAIWGAIGAAGIFV
jgi:penicillin-binding protein 1A